VEEAKVVAVAHRGDFAQQRAAAQEVRLDVGGGRDAPDVVAVEVAQGQGAPGAEQREAGEEEARGAVPLMEGGLLLLLLLCVFAFGLVAGGPFHREVDRENWTRCVFKHEG
jgi:hypothetical protein